MIDEAKKPDLHKEIFQHMVELTTGICRHAQEVEEQMGAHVRLVLDLAAKRNLLVTGTGRPPSIKLAECRRVPDPRYDYLEEGRKVLNQRFGTLGTHIHLGMESPKNACAIIISTCISCRI